MFRTMVKRARDVIITDSEKKFIRILEILPPYARLADMNPHKNRSVNRKAVLTLYMVATSLFHNDSLCEL